VREWDPQTAEYTDRAIETNASYVGKFAVDDLFWPKAEIEEKGLLILSPE
jgi:hypothetical protein